MKNLLALVAVAACTAPVCAQVWVEVGDAPGRIAPNGTPSAPEQMTVGFGPLLSIMGMGERDAAGLIDPDVYCVHIDGQFSASTVGSLPVYDTMLALYDATGATQLFFNDDNPFPQSLISGFVAPGNYKLAITRFADVDFNDGGSFGTTAYTISLTGMSYCEVPGPGSLALLAAGAIPFARRRRR